MSEPTQYEVERAFYRLLDNGDEAAIARETGKSASYVSQLYDPNCERESHLFRAIKELRAWRRESMTRGCSALETLIFFVEYDLEPEPLCVINETKQLKREVDEWENAEMSCESPSSRVEQIRDVKLQAERTINAHAQYLRGVAKQAIVAKGGRAS
jgi:hypothetical protein